MSTDPQTRHGIAQRALERARARGVALDEDAEFMVLLDEWIRGDIPMRVMRERYFSAFAEREKERLLRRTLALPITAPTASATLPADPDEKEGPPVGTAALES